MNRTPPFDVAQAQRWFAVEMNNQAWDLVEAPSRSAEQVERMLHAAHAACAHWLVAGGPIHHMRALSLLSFAYAAAGDGPAAVRWAQRTIELQNMAPAAEVAPFDRAVNAAALTRGLRVAGQSTAEAQASTEQALATLTDTDEKSLVEKLLAG